MVHLKIALLCLHASVYLSLLWRFLHGVHADRVSLVLRLEITLSIEVLEWSLGLICDLPWLLLLPPFDPDLLFRLRPHGFGDLVYVVLVVWVVEQRVQQSLPLEVFAWGLCKVSVARIV